MKIKVTDETTIKIPIREIILPILGVFAVLVIAAMLMT